MLISPASSPNSHWRDDGDLGDRLAVCSAETKGGKRGVRRDGELSSQNSEDAAERKDGLQEHARMQE